MHFSAFGIVLGHVVCHFGILVDPTKIEIIIDLPPPPTLKQLRTTLGHTWYDREFNRGYVEVTPTMEKLFKKYVKFQWSEQCRVWMS